MGIACSFLTGENLNYSFGERKGKPTHPLHFQFKHTHEENKLKREVLSINILSSLVSLPRAPGHHSCGSSTTNNPDRSIPELVIMFPTLPPAPTATLIRISPSLVPPNTEEAVTRARSFLASQAVHGGGFHGLVRGHAMDPHPCTGHPKGYGWKESRKVLGIEGQVERGL